MTRLFIVDDEEEIRNGLKNKIDWASHDIVVCGVAENGAQALEQIATTQPEIMLVDIMMPVMNGLDLIKNITAKWPDIKTIIISGHDDFKYAQAALRLGAVDYLLKPSKPEEIFAAIQKAKNIIFELNLKKEPNNQIDGLLQQKDRFLRKLIENEFYDLDYVLNRFNKLGINLHVDQTTVAIIQIDKLALTIDHPQYFDDLLLKIISTSSEFLRKKIPVEVLEYSSMIVLVFDSFESNNLISYLEDLKNRIQSIFSISITIGLGSLKTGAGKMHLSFLEAQKAIKAKQLICSDTVIAFETVKDAYVRKIAYPLRIEKKIIENLKLPEAEGMLEELTAEFFKELNVDQISQDYCIKACLSLLLSAYHYCADTNINSEEIFGTNLSYIDDLQQMSSITQIQLRILQILKAINHASFGNKHLNHTIKLATNYMKQHFTENIPLETVAGQVFVSPQYLSRLFKTVLDINFLEYLNQLRVEFAIELLSNPELKVYEIASLCGYKNEKYFGVIFRKKTGKTPVQFRGNLLTKS